MVFRGWVILVLATAAALVAAHGVAAAEPTYAERLGWPAGSRVVIFHVDDAGMSHDSNMGAFESIEQGVATSVSVMFPCAWVSEFAKHWKQHPEIDAGIHVTLTSEWDKYRWGPVAGKEAVPGLVDPQGCLWHGGDDVLKHASPDEVETEIRAQLDRCVTIGITPTHLDTHMGVVFARPDYTERYLKVGIEKKIPVMLAAGHFQYLVEENKEALEMARAAGLKAWDAGLPCLDDIHTGSYGWKPEEKKAKLIEFLHTMKPGLTQVILHCTKPTQVFEFISGSGASRLADTQVMTDPDIKKVLADEKILTTSWRELMERRGRVGTPAAAAAEKK
jgi:predicted glycoside hydrolase/deacetylase ChbG (UPF0249 family)